MSSLNVKDALAYLDQVKVQFSDHPDVYNKFLDIMKDFKSQHIDTPGVIERVSALFQGHASLIQGFNTFLPAGYHIECSEDTNLITVTTPTGTTTAQGGIGIAGALSRANAAALAGVAPESLPPQPPPPGHHSRSISPMSHVQPRTTGPPHAMVPGAPTDNPAMHPPPHGPMPYPGAGYVMQPTLSGGPFPNGSGHAPPAPGTPGATAGAGALTHPSAAPAQQEARPPVEFNHAINYVNKIKQRFNAAPDTYKQFLEILQTYQRDSRPIQEVYAEVTLLFGNDKDLLDEFRQFLPDNSNGDGGGGLFGAMMAPPTAPPDFRRGPTAYAPEEPRRDRAGGEPKSKKRGAGADATGAAPPAESRGKRAKHAYSVPPEQHPAEVPPNGAVCPEEMVVPVQAGEPAYAPSIDAAWYPAEAVFGVGVEYPTHRSKEDTLASLGEVALFDRIKRHIDAKSAYTEFLKLLSLFSRDIIDARLLLDQAALFIGDNADLFGMFCNMVGYDQGKDDWLTNVRPTINNIPAGRRDMVQPLLYKPYGPSYRRLPKVESNLSCSGRDALCWSVLNDSFLSAPLINSESEGFQPHKKNVYEDALFRSEEERHEFDHHIELNLRTIELLIPLVARFEAMPAAEREVARLPKDLGAQSPTIHERVIKKVYGKEAGLEILAAMSEAPATTLPIVLERLKETDKTWRARQKEWNRIWHEVDVRNFYKSLDHEGFMFKANDKRATTSKAFVTEIESERARQLAQHQAAARRERTNETRLGSDDPAAGLVRAWPCYQHAVKLNDKTVFSDVLKMCVSHLDRTTNYSKPDMERIEAFLHSFGPLVFGLDPSEVDAWIAPIRSDEDDDEEENSSHDAAEGNTKEPTPKDKELPDEAPQEPPKDAATDADNATEPPSAIGKSEGSEIDTWMRFGGFASSGTATPATSEEQVDLPNDIDSLFFYANTQLFVFLKLFETVYVRLLKLKEVAAKRAEVYPSKQRMNPVAVALGLQDPTTGPGAVVGALAYAANEDPERQGGLFLHPSHYYGTLLEMCERLFDGDMDQSTFEEAARYMFGIDAYPIYTVDKVVSSLVKAVHNLATDQKSVALMEQVASSRTRTQAATKALKADPKSDRAMVEWFRTLIDQRMASEGILASDENLYRVVWSPRSQLLMFTLLGSDELTVPQEATSERNKRLYYAASYASWYPTESLPRVAVARLLPHNLALAGQPKSRQIPSTEGSEGSNEPSSTKGQIPVEQVSYTSQHGLEGRINPRSCRLHFEQGQDDLMVRHRPRIELTARDSALSTTRAHKETRFLALLAKRLETSRPVPSPVSNGHQEPHQEPMDLDGATENP